MTPDKYYYFTIIIINVIVVGFLIRFKTYMTKKGENQATKEDLKELTTIVENIKKDNASDLEELKKNLSISSERAKQYYEEERSIIINFWNMLHNIMIETIYVDKVVIPKVIDEFNNNKALYFSYYKDLSKLSNQIELIIKDKEISIKASLLVTLYKNYIDLIDRISVLLKKKPVRETYVNNLANSKDIVEHKKNSEELIIFDKKLQSELKEVTDKLDVFNKELGETRKEFKTLSQEYLSS